MKASAKRIVGCVQDIPGIGSLYNVNLSQVVDSVYRLCAQRFGVCLSVGGEVLILKKKNDLLLNLLG